jgi:AraC family transcriptional regulator
MVEGGCVEQKKEAFEIMPGNVTYYSPGEKHRVVKVVKASRRVNLELEQQFFRQFDLQDYEARKAVYRNPDAKFLMIKMYKELLGGDAISTVTIQMTLLQLISQTKAFDKVSRPEHWARRLDEYLRHCPDEHVSLRELAYMANLHPVTLSKKFPQYFNCTIGAYKRKLKIEKSLSLIKSSTLSLTEIALECGFFDQNHFIRTFKSATGFLPLAYRKS